jgi:hypothetical protein
MHFIAFYTTAGKAYKNKIIAKLYGYCTYTKFFLDFEMRFVLGIMQGFR